MFQSTIFCKPKIKYFLTSVIKLQKIHLLFTTHFLICRKFEYTREILLQFREELVQRKLNADKGHGDHAGGFGGFGAGAGAGTVKRPSHTVVHDRVRKNLKQLHFCSDDSCIKEKNYFNTRVKYLFFVLLQDKISTLVIRAPSLNSES